MWAQTSKLKSVVFRPSQSHHKIQLSTEMNCHSLIWFPMVCAETVSWKSTGRSCHFSIIWFRKATSLAQSCLPLHHFSFVRRLLFLKDYSYKLWKRKLHVIMDPAVFHHLPCFFYDCLILTHLINQCHSSCLTLTTQGSQSEVEMNVFCPRWQLKWTLMQTIAGQFNSESV